MYKRVPPVSIAEVEQMTRQRYKGHFTICQTLRDIYMLTDNEEIRLKCRTAMAMAKKMQDKLKSYKDLQEKIDKMKADGVQV